MGLTTITNIPRIMRSNLWLSGAQLMDTWFSRAAAIKPNYGPPETATITMLWVLFFPKARAIYQKLMAERIWANTAAQKEIAKMLNRQGLLLPHSMMPAPRPFGNLTQPAWLQDPDYVNERSVKFDGVDDPLDDMVAALADFNIRVLVSGSVAAASDPYEYRVTITDIGVYIQDSYDFNGFQHLGFWDEITNSASKADIVNGSWVTNKDFRDWRSTSGTGRGGDFIVFSDIKRIHLPAPDTFIIKNIPPL